MVHSGQAFETVISEVCPTYHSFSALFRKKGYNINTYIYVHIYNMYVFIHGCMYMRIYKTGNDPRQAGRSVI